MSWLELITEDSFYEFALILFFAAVFGSIGQLFRQPLIVMFIALGVVVGPSVLNIVQSKENIHLLAEIGISILLFIVGLKLDLRLIKSTGKIALMTGLGQVLFTSLVGYLIGLGLGFSSLHSFYIAVALTFSSTIIIVKLLSDKKEIDSLHGQIAIGFLIVQDLVVILVMIILAAIGKEGETSLLTDISLTLLNGTGLIIFTFAMMKWVIPSFSYFLAKSQELLVLFAIAWAITLASVSEMIGFSGEVGAFLAGVSLASSPFKDTISSRLVSLRDFLLLFFFVNLGSNLNLEIIGAQLPAALLFSAFVLIGNPIIVLIIMGAMGYRKRTSFLAGLTVAQISEFSLIFVSLGFQVGHLNEETVGLVTLVGMVTIALSTYLILYSHQIFYYISPALRIFERQNPYREEGMEIDEQHRYSLIIFGMGRFGSKMAEQLDRHRVKYLGVDFDPELVKEWQNHENPIIYGDIEDPEILDRIPLLSAQCIVCTIPNREYSLQLTKKLRSHNFKGKVLVTATNEKDYAALSGGAADFVLRPYDMAAENFYQLLVQNFEMDTSTFTASR